MGTDGCYLASVTFEGIDSSDHKQLYDAATRLISKFIYGSIVFDVNGNVSLVLDEHNLSSLVQSKLKPSYRLFNRLLSTQQKVVLVKTHQGLYFVPSRSLPDIAQNPNRISVRKNNHATNKNENVQKLSKPYWKTRKSGKTRKLNPKSENTIYSLKQIRYSPLSKTYTDRSPFRVGKDDDYRFRAPIITPSDQGNYNKALVRNYDNDVEKYSVEEDGHDADSDQRFPIQASDAQDGARGHPENQVYTATEEAHTSLLQQEYQNRPRIQTPARHPDYMSLQLRLETFRNWPHHDDIQDRNRLAQTGLFYTGNQDLVRCFHCGIGLKDWASSDDPLQVHIRHSHDCEFLRATISQSELETYRVLLSDVNETSTCNQGIDSHQNSQGRDTLPHSRRYRNPNYQEYDVRVDSFTNWPSNIVQTPQQLAEAGFFYTGMEDIVRCYACDGGLRKWDSDDDPWIEHAHWFPHCVHVIRERGQEYIDLIQVVAADGEEEDIGGQSGTMEHLYSNNSSGRESDDPIYSPAAQTAIDFGFSRTAVKMAIRECNDKHIRWKAEDLVNLLLEKQENGEVLPPDSPRTQSPVLRRKINTSTKNGIVAENKMLKCKLKCILCEEEDVNVLFLPCAHHNMCMTCAEVVTMCPICGKTIKEKIKTFMS